MARQANSRVAGRRGRSEKARFQYWRKRSVATAAVGLQRTLVLLKPDCVQRRLVGTILQRFDQKGLRLVGLKLVRASQELASAHYAVHKDRPFYNSLLTFLTSGPTVAALLEGREAVSVVRALMGPTD